MCDTGYIKAVFPFSSYLLQYAVYVNGGLDASY